MEKRRMMDRLAAMASALLARKPETDPEMERLIEKISKPYTDEVREICQRRLAENSEYIALITANPDVKIMFPEMRDVYALKENEEKAS